MSSIKPLPTHHSRSLPPSAASRKSFPTISTGLPLSAQERVSTRENGAKPLRGRRCDRPGLRTRRRTKSVSSRHCEMREGGSGAVMSRKPEDLPAEELYRCFGHKHPGRHGGG